MLNDHERETLLDIERRMLTEDPRWTQIFDDAVGRTARQRAVEWVAYIVALVLTVALTVVLLAADAPGTALFFAAVSGLLIWLIRRRHQSATHPDTGQSNTDPSDTDPPT